MTHSQRNPRPGEVWTDPESGRKFECWERGPYGPSTYWLVTIDPQPYEQPHVLAQIQNGVWLNPEALRRYAG